MADLIFPSNPAVGDEFTGTFGEIFTWDGIKWTLTADGAPAVPQPGSVQFVDGVLQYWDGSAWQEVPVGGGWPAMGVTNGSNAAPGIVGEFVNVNSPTMTGVSSIPGTSPTNITGAQLTLTPGDWDVSGQVNFLFMDQAGSGATPWGIVYSLVGALFSSPTQIPVGPGSSYISFGGPGETAGGLYLGIAGQGGNWTIPLGPTRMSITVNNQILCRYSANFTTTFCQVSASIRARRMR